MGRNDLDDDTKKNILSETKLLTKMAENLVSTIIIKEEVKELSENFFK